MKRRFLAMLFVSVVGLSVMMGCSQDANNGSNEVVQEESTVATTDEESTEAVSEVVGVVEEIKDFMFIVTDDNNMSYAFTHDEKPEGMNGVAIGDRVLVRYTGTISMVDAFMGEILSVEKQ